VPSDSTRAIAYINLFTHHVDGEINAVMSGSINQIFTIGRVEFKEHIEVFIGRRMQPKKQSRPLRSKD